MAKLYVSITVDWEGEHLRDLEDLRTTRDAIQQSLGAAVPFTHFICPTYWLSPDQPVDPARAIRSILEMPGNGGISDYASADSMTKTFDGLLTMARASEVSLFFNIGCHQEGAGRWKKPLIDFFHGRRRELSSDDVVITTVAKAAQRAARG